jgi:hypothetical protein
MSFLSSTSKTCWDVRIRRALQLLGGTMGVLLLCLPVFSQGNFGRILGTVADQSGGVLAGAAVTVVDTARGVTRILTTDSAGEYDASTLTPGIYSVRVEAKGFKTVERQNIEVGVGKEVRVDLTPQPGDQQQTITVTEAIPLVETSTSTLGGSMSNEDISDLPLNGRNYQNLVGLRPGVMVQPGGGPWTQSTNGIRPDEVAWNVDGVLNANFFDGRPVANMPSPFSDAATILPIDAIQEFNIEENPKAEWGWKAGAVVNVGIKSGTNGLHGTAYAFGRTDSWDARNFFNVAPTNGGCPLNPAVPAVCNKTQAELKQFGGVVGGPIKKDKLFFFGGYEGLRSLIGNTFAVAGGVPETAGQATPNPATSMVNAIMDLQARHIPVSPVSLALAGCPKGALTSTSTCTGGVFPLSPNTTNFLSTFPNQNKSDNGVAKIDYHINAKHALNGMIFFGNYTSNGEDHPFVNQAFTDTAPIRTWSTVENWIYVPSSTVVNELRFGYDRTDFSFVNDDVNKLSNGTSTGYPINTGVTNPKAGGLPNINIQPFTDSLGTAANRPQYFSPNPYYSISDSLSYLKGKHGLKFGGEYMHIEAESGIFVDGRGAFNFNGGLAFAGSPGLEDFFAGIPAQGALLTGNALLKTTWKHSAGYVQDDWNINPRLTLNLGLRYEYHSPISAANNLFGSFSPTLGMVQQGQPGFDTTWKPDRKDFSPRVGFAWDVTGRGTTVVRGGASVIYSSFVLLTFLGEFGLQNNGATSPAAVPTGANLVVNGVTTPGNGTIKLGTVSFGPGQLCWDPATCSIPSQGTAFPNPSGAAPRCGSGQGTDPAPCSIMGVDPNLRSPFITNWNLSVQHAFSTNLALEVAYVGNHGSDLVGFKDINQPPLGAGWCMNTLTAAQAADACKGVTPGAKFNYQAAIEAAPYYAKFPYLGYINWASNNVRSNFDSLQVTLTKRLSSGLSFIAGYTYAHGLDNGSLNRFGLLPQDSRNTGAEYGSSDFDIRHRFTLTTTYNLPGKSGFGQLLEGWQINSIINIQTPQPWYAFDAVNNFSGTGENADRWDIFGSPDGFRSGRSTIPYCTSGGCAVSNIFGPSSFSASDSAAMYRKCTAVAPDPTTLAAAGCFVGSSGVLVPPARGTLGDMGRNIFRDSGFKNWDLSLFKNFTWKDRFGAQFRAELFNVFNHANIANPYGASNFYGGGDAFNAPGGFGFGGATPDVAAGNNLIGSGSARVIQLGLKLKF